jgi:hypothetical protein
MPVQTRSMIKREMQKQQETQQQQQTQEKRLTEEYNKMKYVEEFNITELNMTQQYIQSVLSKNTIILKKKS